MKENINIEKSLAHIELVRDEDEKNLLKNHLEKEKFFVDNDGMTNYSFETIREINKIKVSKMSPEERVLDLQISHLNSLNINLNTEYNINDEIVLLGVITTIQSIRQHIKEDSEYWNEVEKYAKSLIK